MKKKIIIIGGGIAGLSAGIHGLINGFDVEIYEQHTLPGGLCTSWKRGEYTFDGCIHWLTGSSPANMFYNYWKEIGALDGTTIVDHEVYARYVYDEG